MECHPLKCGGDYRNEYIRNRKNNAVSRGFAQSDYVQAAYKGWHHQGRFHAGANVSPHNGLPKIKERLMIKQVFDVKFYFP